MRKPRTVWMTEERARTRSGRWGEWYLPIVGVRVFLSEAEAEDHAAGLRQDFFGCRPVRFVEATPKRRARE